MFINYLKIAWRNLVKQRSITFINLFGLAIGMCAAVLIFLWVHNELNFDNFHKDADRIYRTKVSLAIDKEQTWIWESSPYLLGEHAKNELPEIENMTRLMPMFYNAPYFQYKGEYFKEEKAAYVDTEWFNIFSYTFLKGQPSGFNQNPFSIIMTESRSKKFFGNEDPIGKSLRIDTTDYIVRGVIEDYPPNSSFQYHAFIPYASRALDSNNRKNDAYWGNFNHMTFFKLKPLSDPGKINAKLKQIMSRNRSNDKSSFQLVALKDIHFENDLQSSQLLHGQRKMVNIFAVLGLLLLVIACINYVNLTTAKASIRTKEVSIKKIVGAPRIQLFFQFLLESALLSLLALALTIVLLYLTLPYYNEFTEKNFSLKIHLSSIWMILGGTLLATIILTSIYPALLLSSFKPLSIFRGTNIFKVKDGALRKSLVVLQFVISITLIIGTIIIYKQMQFVNMKHADYDRSHMFTFTIPWKVLGKLSDEKRNSTTSALRYELSQHSKVSNVSLMNQNSVINMTGYSSGESNDWEGRADDFMPSIAFFHADTNFKSILNLKMQSGHWFRPGNADIHNSILNETAVREFRIKEPVIGQWFVSQGDTGVIIGVVKDFYYKSLHEKIGPVVIRNDDVYSSTFLVKSEPGAAVESVKAAETTWKKFFPNVPFSHKYLDEEFNALYTNDRKASTLIWIFSGLAILISCLGLYALAAFTAERRSKEISIRKVLGASVQGIVTLLSKEFVLLIVTALLVAIPLAWLSMNKWLEEFAYRINISWWIFCIAGLIALVIAFISVSVHAIKAASKNPADTLRTE